MSDLSHDVTPRELSIELHALRDKVGDRFSSMDKALDKAEDNLKHYKLENNEWRKSLEDIRSLTMSRGEVMAELKGIQMQMDTLKAAQNTSSGRISGINASWGLVLTLGGLLLTAIMAIIMLMKK